MIKFVRKSSQNTKNYLVVHNPPKNLNKDFQIYPEFISQDEHDTLVSEVEPILQKRKYEKGHLDKVITGYREVNKSWSQWSPTSLEIFSRIRKLLPETKWLPGIHILDLKEDGEIYTHIDNIEASGPTIVGLCLLSDCIMKLNNENTDSSISVYLPSKSLYIMRDTIRYQYGHAILKGPIEHHNMMVNKNRRISILLRDEISKDFKKEEL